jgi:hypothetical protein
MLGATAELTEGSLTRCDRSFLIPPQLLHVEPCVERVAFRQTQGRLDVFPSFVPLPLDFGRSYFIEAEFPPPLIPDFFHQNLDADKCKAGQSCPKSDEFSCLLSNDLQPAEHGSGPANKD